MKDEWICSDGVNRIIDAQLKSYVVQDSTVLSGYIQRSRECIAQYNGRQIFEMLQNVDDQLDSADEEDRACQIFLDKDNGLLVFRNKGKRPFTVKGVQSIMYPDSSQKRIEKLDAIGNKGLGFRSLLNWDPKEIFIRSKDVELLFSQGVLEEDYLNPDKQKNKELIRALSDAAETRLPILTFPRIHGWDGSPDGWITEIELRGIHNAVEEIDCELQSFKPELMLFLRHLREVSIQIRENGKVNVIRYSATKSEQVLDEKLRLQNRSITKTSNGIDETTKWLICWQNGSLGNKGKELKYNVEVGIPDNGRDRLLRDGVLYNYLPTKVRIKLPCLIHATVRLEDHRNALVTRDQLNAKLCGDVIPNVVVNLAMAIRDNGLIDDKWLPFSLLAAPLECDDTEYIGKTYLQLRAALNKLEICPCVDGKWRKLVNSRYCAPSAIDKVNITEFFNEHVQLLPSYVCRGAPSQLSDFRCVQIGDGNEFVRQLNAGLLNHDGECKYSAGELTDLICILWQMVQGKMHLDDPCRLLIDGSGKIFDASTDTVYTPASKDKICLPQYMNASYVADAQWNEIKVRFASEIDKFVLPGDASNDAGNKKERAFCTHVLRDLLKLQIEYYDRHNVALQMVRVSRQKLSADGIDVAEKRDLISQLFAALLENYRDDNEPGNREDSVPLFADDGGRILCANDFLFEKAREIYGDSLPSAVFLDDKKIGMLFEGCDAVVDRMKFLRYLGVRGDVRVRYKSITTTPGHADDPYLQFLMKKGTANGGLPEASHTYAPLKTALKVTCIHEDDLRALKALPFDRFFKLFGMEHCDGICSLIDYEPGKVSWNAVNGRDDSYYEYGVKWSYATYQLQDRFAGVIFGENDKVLSDLNFRLVQDQPGVPPSVLIKLGAKSKLSDLSQDELYGLVNRVAESNPPKRPTKDFYKKINAALTALELRGEKISPPATLKVYAGSYGFMLASMVFYHDNPSHAILLAKNKPMMYLSSRVGVDKVCRHFGVQKLNESDIELGECNNVEKVLQNKFDGYFLSKAPLLGLLLCQRRSATLDSCNKEIAGVQINLVRSMNYAYGRGNTPDTALDDFAYLRNPDEGARVFYLNIGDRNDFDDLPQDERRKFYGAIAGILCDVVKLSDELLERQFYDCFADEEKVRIDLEDAGYLDGVDLTTVVMKNYFNSHFYALKNIADTVFIERIKPAVWCFLNKNSELQENYVQYEGAYRLFINSALSDGGELANVCSEKQNEVWEDADQRATFIDFISKASWWQDLPRPLPEGWKCEQINDDIENEPDPDELYPQLSGLEIEGSRISSLSYFKGNGDKINEMLEAKAKADAAREAADQEDEIKLLSRSESDAVFKRPVVTSGDSGKKVGAGQAMTERKMRNQKKKGDLAEKLVEYWLKEAPENKHSISKVERVSGASRNSSRNDALHYDIRYVDTKGFTHYVEVKACDSGEFHISPGELKFAEEHPETYHLALVYVDATEVKVVDDVFHKLANVRIPDGWKVAVEK